MSCELIEYGVIIVNEKKNLALRLKPHIFENYQYDLKLALNNNEIKLQHFLQIYKIAFNVALRRYRKLKRSVAYKASYF